MNNDRPPSVDGPRQAPAQGVAGLRDEGGIELRRAGLPIEPPVVADGSAHRPGRSLAGLMRPELARWRVGGERRDDGRAVTAGTRSTRGAASMTTAGTTGSTRTSIVPPQASPTSHACSSLIP